VWGGGQRPEHNNQHQQGSFFVSFLFYIFRGHLFNINTFPNSSNMDTDPETTPGNNAEDALVESSPIGVHAARDDDDVQIVPPPPPPPLQRVITISARRAKMAMTNKANRRSNGSYLPSPIRKRSALPSQMST
jgi:hypothetical protein